MGQKKKVISQGNKVNQLDEQARAQGYWHQTSGEFYYKCYYVDNEIKGLVEYLVDELGIQNDYYAR
jgi:hypothetical protein